jgi:enamine deaminase RidA (YjgF/YER057c/UK114 family)
VDLRKQVDETLLKRRAEIEKQLTRMGAVVSWSIFFPSLIDFLIDKSAGKGRKKRKVKS